MNAHLDAIMNREGQPEFWPHLRAESQWFHIVRSMIVRGDMAKMGTVGWAVYCVMKAHTNLNDGKSYPSQARIASMIDASVDTVARATDKLILLGYVEKRKRGNRNEYYLKEKVPVSTKDGQVVATGETTYIPMLFEKFAKEMQAFASDGSISNGSKIEFKFNINIINQGDNSTVNINNVSMSAEGVADAEKNIWSQIVSKVNRVTD